MLHFRSATPADAPAIAALHARSWQLTYRGDFSDAYLDEQAPQERLEVWTARFAVPNPKMRVTLAEDENGLQGFCCVFLDHDADGHLLDNLHVAPGNHRRGIGRQLMQRSAGQVAQTDPEGLIYLWVLLSNTNAISVYEHLGGRRGRTEIQHFAAGNNTPAVMMQWTVREMAELT